MKRSLVSFVLAGSLALAVVTTSSGGTFRGITPYVMSGYPSCSQLSGVRSSNAVTFSPPLNGASSNGLFLLVNSNSSLGWYVVRDVRDIAVRAVIVKGGPASNVYVYPGGDYSDGPLTAPRNPKNGKPYDVGSATFCFDIAS